MRELIRQGIATRRFRYGVIGVTVSVLFLLLSILFNDGAQKRLGVIEQDPRFETAAWEKLSADEQQRLGRELMSAKNNLGQIAMGKVLFSITLTISFLLLIVAFVRIKTKLDEFIEEDEKRTSD
ncbi:MAG TPA: hypothetical protein PLV42_09950 [bacterium]|nr:hypothetical protein [bacterium]